MSTHGIAARSLGHLAIVAAAIWTATAGTAEASFVLKGTAHLDVQEDHSIGVMWDSSTANVEGSGTEVTRAYVNDSASMNVQQNGVVLTAYVYDDATIQFSTGGDASNVYAYDNAFVGLSASNCSISSLYAQGRSSIDLLDCTISNYYGEAQSTAEMSAGYISRAYVRDASSFMVSGGEIIQLYGSGGSNVHIQGGTITELQAQDGSTINLHGSDFRATGGIIFTGTQFIGTGVITGVGTTGDDWILRVTQNESTAMIVPYAEPATPSVLLGDANNDGVVSADDFAAVQANFGKVAASEGLPISGGNTGHLFSADDFAAIQSNFGRVAGATHTTAPVPEPTTLTLLIIATGMLVRRSA